MKRLPVVHFILRYRLDRRLWGGELKGPCGRRRLCGLGHSGHQPCCHGGRRERMGQVHRLPAFLLVSLCVV